MADIVMADETERDQELRSKRICRFCMSMEEPLSDLYSQENRLKTRVPLPLQIMSCVSIEVFTNDGMPRTVCDPCRLLMDFNYRFKQMCKKSELLLRQYPLTGVWSPKIPLPVYPQELLDVKPILTPIKRKLIARPQEVPTTTIVETVEPINLLPESSSEPLKKRPLLATQAHTPKNNTKPNDPHVKATEQLSLLKQGKPDVKPRILNQTAAKVLNIGATAVQLRSPDFKTKEDGGIELVFEPTTSDAVQTDIFPCTECDRTFPLRQLLEMHMIKHKRDRTSECEFCDKKFFSKYDLSKHMLTHSFVKPFVCSVCNQGFARSTQLSRHEKSHSDHPTFLCSFCEKSFLNLPDLERHEENHRKTRPFPCTQCDKTFAFKQGLERHEVIHQAEQPFKCQYCGIGVSTASKLARHLTVHAGGRPYPCRLCPKSYLLSHHLTRHVRSHKNSQSTYMCNTCSEQFNSLNSLLVHSKSHAADRLTCPLCREKFATPDEASAHILTHEGEQFACEFCDLIFAKEELKEQHCEQEHSDEQAEYEKDDETRHVKAEANESADIENQSDPEEEEEDPVIMQQYMELLDQQPKRGRPRKNPVVQPTILNYIKSARPKTPTDKEGKGHSIKNSETKHDEQDIENMEFEMMDVVVKMSPNTKSPVKKQLAFTKKESPPKKVAPTQHVSKAAPSPVQKASPHKPVPVAQQKLEQELQQALKTSPAAPKPTPGKPVLTKINMKKLPPGVTLKKIPSAGPAEPVNTATPKRVLNTGRTTPNKTPNEAASNKPVVQRVKMTQAQVDAMAKEGKIQVRNGQVFLRSTK